MSEQDGCWSCTQHANPAPPPREQIVLTEHWHAAHAFNSTLPGWLVLLPNRHVGAEDQDDWLSEDERDRLGARVAEAYQRV